LEEGKSILEKLNKLDLVPEIIKWENVIYYIKKTQSQDGIYNF